MTFLCGFPTLGRDAPKVAERAPEPEEFARAELTAAQLFGTVYNLGARWANVHFRRPNLRGLMPRRHRGNFQCSGCPDIQSRGAFETNVYR